MGAMPETVPKPGSIGSEITYRIACSQWELEQAFSLVYRAYVRVGLETERAGAIRLTKYHLWPGTRVFIAVEQAGSKQERVVGTLSVVHDSPLGLPAESAACREIGGVRSSGHRVAEFIALASDEVGRRNRVTLKLFRLAFDYCLSSGVSLILAALTERHVGFYRRFLGFRPLGDMLPYAYGNGMPVQVHALRTRESEALVRQRAAAFEHEPDWQLFAMHDLGRILRAASRINPWNAGLVQYFIRQSAELRAQLDKQTISSLRAEYARHGRHFPLQASSASAKEAVYGFGPMPAPSRAGLGPVADSCREFPPMFGGVKTEA